MMIDTLTPYFEIVDVFKCENRQCVIVKGYNPISGSFHNGYVEMLSSKSEYCELDNLNMEFENSITFGPSKLPLEGYKDGDKHLYLKELTFLGFDTMHAWNVFENPDSQSKGAVIKETVRLCKDMARLEI